MKKLIAVVLFAPCMAWAEFYTGNDLYMKITDENSMVNRMVATGYVVGVYDVGAHLFFCPPKPESGITVGQISDMVKNWLAVNAHRRNELAYSLITDLFSKNWPCANKKNGVGV